MRYFATEATGFIGKRLVRKPLRRDGSEAYFLLREQSRGKLPALLDYWAGPVATRLVCVDVRQARLEISDRSPNAEWQNRSFLSSRRDP